ncbi:SusC/RagA family TonB-linked outer membrane protein [Myroides odoratimimus]|uniref:SusC/RagA family TonB-linked outer membrane protein n=1 Tax=Myroides odoratimimus CIP 101113 TaxID=883154 RepID=A0AAV3EXY5_9FLAO|nr:SusC/RagA family TonB-linked outer membrane protein [Myroides odoratimimus]EHO04885.1 SusC/RagA family TonB-linked outer membrane protein [Myroides odoratimimus CIP 101113]MEC4051322.1 SusC/RagA family TonB-linked outer membrane protein [Myroides odoratimimus]
MKKSRLNWFYASLLLLSVSAGYAQDKKLTGVVSEGGTPLPGVSVTIQGTNHGTQTDLDGNYSLNVKPGDVLVFSFIGMKDITYKVGEASIYNPTLLSEDSQLGEVVVLAYGQTKTRNEITGNVVSVKGDIISNTPVASIDQALQGRVAGLHIAATSGSPGSLQNIRIRGRNSISASNEPLYVVDGVPMVNTNISGNTNGTSLSALSAISSDDIESMTVLKDAAATSAYGARGSNGVILITTKKGRQGTPSFNLKTSIGFQNPARKGPKFLDGNQKKDLWLEAIYNTYGEEFKFTKEETWDWYTGPDNKKVAVNGELYNWVKNGGVSNDWSKAVQVDDAKMSILNFSVNGGDEKGTYFGSITHEKYDGTVIGSDFRKVNGSFNFSRKLSDKVEIKIGAMVSNIKQNGILEGGAYFSNPNLARSFMSPWFDIYDKEGNYNLSQSRNNLPNILYVVENNKYQNDITRVISNNSLGYKILDNLKFESAINLDYTLSNYSTYYNPIHGDGKARDGLTSEADRKIFNYVWQNSLDYTFYIGDLHKFNAKALMEFQKNKFNYLYGGGEVLPPGLTSVGAAAANFSSSTAYEDWTQLSYLGMLNYAYDNRYLVDFTLRREGSSRFSEENRWGTFYAIGAAWNINSEDFLKDVEALSLLRLRGSYGTTGNSGIALNTYQQMLSATAYNNKAGLAISQLGGPLGWEKQQKLDLGIEFGFLDSRITGSFAYFKSKTKDLLYSLPLSRTTGFSSQTKNLGTLENSGIEVELNFDIVRSSDFNWSIGGNIGTVKNKMVKMPIVDGKPLEVYGAYTALVEGKAINTWYLKEYAGVNSQTGLAEWYMADGSRTTNYNAAEVRYQNASALPKLTGGINTHFDYKGFYLDALFTFATGYKIYDSWVGYYNTVNQNSLNNYNGTTELLDRWQNPGDITDVPKLSVAGGSAYTSPSTRFLYDGDHIRLRQLTVGYDLDKKYTRAMKLDGVNLSVSAMNPFTWVKDSRLKSDPEVDATGYIEMASPPVKSVVFSLNVKF